jgi:SEC-C motif-containing protein
MSVCPCGSSADYEACCGRYHAGAPAPTAEALMRSRYTAFAKGLWPYLKQTQVAPFGDDHGLLAWFSLTIDEAQHDQVEFTARYVDGGREVTLHERSKFEQRDGRWLYVGGTPSVTARKVGRNDACPCGSGKKLKQCHG